MCITNVSPTALTGSPVDPMSIPDASIATWPTGSRRIAKISEGVAAIALDTSTRFRSLVYWHGCSRRLERLPAARR